MPAADALSKVLQAMSKHDANGLANLYAADATAYDPFYPQPLKGRDAIRKDAETFFRAFPDLQVRASSMLGNGDVAAVQAAMSGTHRGPLEGLDGTIPATNKRMEMQGAIFVRTNAQGLITEERRYGDPGVVMQQLGLVPTPSG